MHVLPIQRTLTICNLTRIVLGKAKSDDGFIIDLVLTRVPVSGEPPIDHRYRVFSCPTGGGGICLISRVIFGRDGTRGRLTEKGPEQCWKRLAYTCFGCTAAAVSSAASETHVENVPSVKLDVRTRMMINRDKTERKKIKNQTRLMRF